MNLRWTGKYCIAEDLLIWVQPVMIHGITREQLQVEVWSEDYKEDLLYPSQTASGESWWTSDGFQGEPGVLPSGLLQNPSEALVTALNKVMVAKALHQIILMQPLSSHRSYQSPWFAEELKEMKIKKRYLQCCWHSRKDDLDQTQVRATWTCWVWGNEHSS